MKPEIEMNYILSCVFQSQERDLIECFADFEAIKTVLDNWGKPYTVDGQVFKSTETFEYEPGDIRPVFQITAMGSRQVTLDLIGLDGNAFALMGAFQKQARKEGWSDWEIDEVLEECKSGDYDHLLMTLMRHTKTE
jgi:hypothetical protein